MFCTKCGRSATRQDQFCAACGAPLSQSGASAPADPAAGLLSVPPPPRGWSPSPRADKSGPIDDLAPLLRTGAVLAALAILSFFLPLGRQGGGLTVGALTMPWSVLGEPASPATFKILVVFLPVSGLVLLAMVWSRSTELARGIAFLAAGSVFFLLLIGTLHALPRSEEVVTQLVLVVLLFLFASFALVFRAFFCRDTLGQILVGLASFLVILFYLLPLFPEGSSKTSLLSGAIESLSEARGQAAGAMLAGSLLMLLPFLVAVAAPFTSLPWFSEPSRGGLPRVLGFLLLQAPAFMVFLAVLGFVAPRAGLVSLFSGLWGWIFATFPYLATVLGLLLVVSARRRSRTPRSGPPRRSRGRAAGP